jgi:hypothetical protein
MSSDLRVVLTDERELRRLFNKAGFLLRLQAGELMTRLVKDAHPTTPLAKEPYCTRSQLISYLTHDGVEVARVHQYLRRNGELGLSGRPDPKRVRLGMTIYCSLDEPFDLPPDQQRQLDPRN